METSEIIKVGIGDLKVTGNPGILSCSGLGSCIAIVFYDKTLRIGAMAHVMMPDSSRIKESDQGKLNKGKYADTAPAEIVAQMEKFGVKKNNIKAYIFGGANMFPNLFTRSDFLNMGQRNIDAVREKLLEQKIKIYGEDTGGISGRTVTLNTEEGKIESKTIKGEIMVFDI